MQVRLRSHLFILLKGSILLCPTGSFLEGMSIIGARALHAAV